MVEKIVFEVIWLAADELWEVMLVEKLQLKAFKVIKNKRSFVKRPASPDQQSPSKIAISNSFSTLKIATANPSDFSVNMDTLTGADPPPMCGNTQPPS